MPRGARSTRRNVSQEERPRYRRTGGRRAPPAAEPVFFRIIPNIDRSPGCANLLGAVSAAPREKFSDDLSRTLTRSGFRFTAQRRQVYSVLLRKRDHPTAEEVFIRAKRRMPDISLATVYNCLEALVACGLARQLTLERGAARFCPNMREHCHFCCDNCQSVFDVEMPPGRSWPLPAGFEAKRFDLTFHGLCPACGGVGKT